MGNVIVQISTYLQQLGTLRATENPNLNVGSSSNISGFEI